MGSTATDKDLAEFQRILAKITNFRLGHDTRLVDGLYYEHRLMDGHKWVLSIYRNELTLGNDVEIAIDVPPLIWPDNTDPARVRAARTWLERQTSDLENLPSEIHAYQVPNAFRIGMLVPNALEFLQRLQQQFAIRDERQRWQVNENWAAHADELRPTPVVPVTTMPPPPASHAGPGTIERMLRTVLQTCAQSGSQSAVTNKDKCFLFTSQDQFRQVVTDLLSGCGGRCSLTGVPLDLTEQDGDLAPSLDRIDSNGHYEPRNVQVVARFANRWKSDDTDANFKRLLELVRASNS